MSSIRKGRTWTAIALVAVGLALLALGASATLGEQATAPVDDPAWRAATAPPAPADARAVLTIETPLGTEARRVDLPDASLPLPVDVDVDRDLDTGALPLGTRVSLALTDEPAASPTASSVSTTNVPSKRLVLVPATSLAVGAAAFTLAGLATYFWGALKKALLLPVIGLYARVTRAEVFDNTVRERINATIRTQPGISATELAVVVGVSWGTTIYHLDVLEQNRMVTSLRSGRHRRYFENGALLTGSKEAVAVLRNTVTATVATRLREAPGVTQKELATRVGLTPQALHWHLQRLARVGLVRKERAGRVVRHYAPSTN